MPPVPAGGVFSFRAAYRVSGSIRYCRGMATLIRPLADLRAEINARWPNRDRGADGWIGDRAHQGHTSGHNPDDTPGARPAYSDRDGRPEVRALDIDVDLDGTGRATTAAARQRFRLEVISPVVRTARAHPGLLRYIIFDHEIWHADNDWRPSQFHGDPHTDHGHFEGHWSSAQDNTPVNWGIGSNGSAPGPERLVGMLGLKHGDKGESVRFLQLILNDILPPGNVVAVDSDYGDETARGVAAVAGSGDGKAIDAYTLHWIGVQWVRKVG